MSGAPATSDMTVTNGMAAADGTPVHRGMAATHGVAVTRGMAAVDGVAFEDDTPATDGVAVTSGEHATDGVTVPRRAFVQQIMGMPISVHVRGPLVGTPAVERRVATIFEELRGIDAEFSPYRPDSAVNRLNRGELRLAECGPRMREVAELCRRARASTGGYFEAYRPAADGVPRYDPTGLVKGWAVERAARHLDDLEGHDFCLNAGGDVLVKTVDGGTPWRVGVEHPDWSSVLLTSLSLAQGAIATSGSAHRGAHILDPYAGVPAGRLRSVTVVGPSLTWADVYATAAFARGSLHAVPPLGLDGYEALLVDATGAVATTHGWPGALR